MPSETLCTNCERISTCISNVQQLFRDIRAIGPPPEFITIFCIRMGKLNKKATEYLLERAEKDTQKRVSTYTV
jgi:hypothetical protein